MQKPIYKGVLHRNESEHLKSKKNTQQLTR